jgi:hypothetical protein
VGGRTEGGGEDNSDRQPHFLTIFLFISFFFCLSLSLISRLKPRKWETTLGVPKRSNKH